MAWLSAYAYIFVQKNLTEPKNHKRNRPLSGSFLALGDRAHGVYFVPAVLVVEDVDAGDGDVGADLGHEDAVVGADAGIDGVLLPDDMEADGLDDEVAVLA